MKGLIFAIGISFFCLSEVPAQEPTKLPDKARPREIVEAYRKLTTEIRQQEEEAETIRARIFGDAVTPDLQRLRWGPDDYRAEKRMNEITTNLLPKARLERESLTKEWKEKHYESSVFPLEQEAREDKQTYMSNKVGWFWEKRYNIMERKLVAFETGKDHLDFVPDLDGKPWPEKKAIIAQTPPTPPPLPEDSEEPEGGATGEATDPAEGVGPNPPDATETPPANGGDAASVPAPDFPNMSNADIHQWLLADIQIAWDIVGKWLSGGDANLQQKATWVLGDLPPPPATVDNAWEKIRKEAIAKHVEESKDAIALWKSLTPEERHEALKRNENDMWHVVKLMLLSGDMEMTLQVLQALERQSAPEPSPPTPDEPEAEAPMVVGLVTVSVVESPTPFGETEVEGAVVSITWNGPDGVVSTESTTNAEGVFTIEVPLDVPVTFSYKGKSSTVTCTKARPRQAVGFGGIIVNPEGVSTAPDPEVQIPPPPID